MKWPATPRERQQLARELTLRGQLTSPLTDDDLNYLREPLTLYTEDPAALPAHLASYYAFARRPTQRQALIEVLWFIWRKHGGPGYGRRWDKDPAKNGAFITFVLHLFSKAEISSSTHSARTLRHDLKRLHHDDQRGFRLAHYIPRRDPRQQ